MDLRYKPQHYVMMLWGGFAAFGLGLTLCVMGSVSWLWMLGTWILFSFMAMLNSAGFHRLFSHRSYKTSSFWEWFLLIGGTLSCYGSSLQWTLHHCLHHKYSDTDKDPHKFNHWYQIFTMNYLVENASFKSKKAIRWLLRRPGHRWIHNHYWTLPLTLISVLALLSPTALLYLYLAPIGLVIFSAALFNYISHMNGEPNNTAWWTLSTSGEWRHKLHHDKPWLWDLREKWYHVDPGAYFIRLIKK